jgi:hypothetical protein
MKKIFLSLILIVMLTSMFVILNSNVAFADTFNPETYKPEELKEGDVGTFASKIGGISGAIRTVGVSISVIMLAVIGIKYMLASTSEKANYKTSMIPYIIGAVLIGAGSAIVSLIFDIAQDI